MIFLCILIFVIFTLSSLLIYKKFKKTEKLSKKIIAFLISALILCTGLEISIFNINFYITSKYSPTDLSYHLEGNKTESGEYTVLSNGNIEFSEINKEIKNIRIIPGKNAPDVINVSVHLTDEANKYYFSTPERTIYKNVEKSQYINVSTAGKSSHMMITLSSTDAVFDVEAISINEKREFDFSTLRFLLMMCILLFIFLFAPSSDLYKKRLIDSKEAKNNLVMCLMVVQCVVFIITGTMNPTFLGLSYTEDGVTLTPLIYEHHNQYDELAQAILKGKTYIDNNDVPQSLIDLENPYDPVARAVASEESGDNYRWDVAYFNGHYYVYFGIVPLLIMYLPCRALFNAPFPSAFGIIGFAIIFALGVFKLLDIIATKYFRKLSLGTYLITALSFINCCGAMFLVKRPDFYSVPIICAMAFVVWGIYFWIKGKQTEKRRNLYFTAGSLCCALAVGCRPQSVLMCAVAIPLLVGYLFKDKYILSKKGILNTITLATPFIIVAAGIMYYNNIRFGSPFDFGSGYNLTTNDVTKRGFDMGRTGLGIFTYLFQTPQFTATFPFIRNVNIDTNYVGKTISEFCFGGLITCTPVLWYTGALTKVHKTLKEKKLLGVCITLLLIGFATVIADTQAGGLLQRYFSDFGYIFFLLATMVIYGLFEQSKGEETNKNLNTLLFISTIFSAFYTLCLVFSQADVTIDTQRPELFGEFKHLVEFWL